MSDNLVLIGMPASGKSTAGVILAKLLGMDFLDTDLLIQKKTGMKLCDLIAWKGIDGFLQTEEEVCCSIRTDHCVIATGGSVVYGKEAMTHLKAIGRIIYLSVDFPTFSKRLSSVRSRGVVLREGQSLRELYEERVPLYEAYADQTVFERGQSVEDTVSQIIEGL
ncbi:MAG: shikimate kinase [Candidatus Methanomethylophilaceae archaeon]|nr:shikimate kinase [Candidatus Methanomethylophilaceae archaeon]